MLAMLDLRNRVIVVVVYADLRRLFNRAAKHCGNIHLMETLLFAIPIGRPHLRGCGCTSGPVVSWRVMGGGRLLFCLWLSEQGLVLGKYTCNRDRRVRILRSGP